MTVVSQPWFMALMRTMSGIRQPKSWPSQRAGSEALRLHAEFVRWHQWRPVRWKTPRPPDVWRRVPDWAWQLERELRRKEAEKPQPPPPPSPGPPPAKPRIPLPCVFTAYGYRVRELHGGNDVERAQALGARTVLFQRGEGVVGDDVARFRAAGIRPMLWDDLPFDPDAVRSALAELGLADADYCPQVESEQQLDRAVAYSAAIRFKTVVVSGAGFTPAKIRQLAADGLETTLGECYAAAGWPYSDLDRMTWQYEHDGWPGVAPVIGCYDGEHPADHQGIDRYWPNAGIWLLETATAQDAAALQALTVGKAA